MAHKDYKAAVALAYGERTTPVVSAKAQGNLALDMIAEARRHGVLITEDPELLAQLTQLQVDQEIPPELYTAVAVVLSWAYWLKGMSPGDEKSV